MIKERIIHHKLDDLTLTVKSDGVYHGLPATHVKLFQVDTATLSDLQSLPTDTLLVCENGHIVYEHKEGRSSTIQFVGIVDLAVLEQWIAESKKKPRSFADFF